MSARLGGSFIASFAICLVAPRKWQGLGPRPTFLSMFEDWKRAWEQAVANFQRELEEDDQPPGLRATGMRRDLAAAQRALDRLQADIVASRTELSKEEESVITCERRAAMAERIGDVETVRLAQDYGRRHAERADILRRKVEVLQDELAMRQEEFSSMQQQAEVELAEMKKLEENRVQHDAEFRKLDRERRERDAEARLEELKKRMK